MTIGEKKIIKYKYRLYKRLYFNLKKELKNCKNPDERYERACELSALGMEVSNLRRALIDQRFRKSYIDDMLGQIILGEEKIVGGR